jgi:hypothetical protein
MGDIRDPPIPFQHVVQTMKEDHSVKTRDSQITIGSSVDTEISRSTELSKSSDDVEKQGATPAAADQDATLPPTDRGARAYLFLLSAFAIEAIMWGTYHPWSCSRRCRQLRWLLQPSLSASRLSPAIFGLCGKQSLNTLQTELCLFLTRGRLPFDFRCDPLVLREEPGIREQSLPLRNRHPGNCTSPLNPVAHWAPISKLLHSQH